MTNDYLDRLEHHLGAYRGDSDAEFIDNPVARRWLTVGDQRAAVAELRRLRTQVADFPDLLADAQEVALDKLVEAFGEGYDNCRLHLDNEARLKRGVAVTQYSNTLPWPTYVAPQQPKVKCPCGCPVVEDMCSCPDPCPCEPDCVFCLAPNPMRESGDPA